MRQVNRYIIVASMLLMLVTACSKAEDASQATQTIKNSAVSGQTSEAHAQFSLHSIFERYEHNAPRPIKTGSGVRHSELPIADAVVINGKIYTVNPKQPWAEAVAIKNSKIILVGTNAEVGDLVGSHTHIYDVENDFVMPGIIDPHIHPGILMSKRAFCALPGTFEEPTEAQILEKLQQCVEQYPADRKWFIAQGYTTPAMNEKTLTREHLNHALWPGSRTRQAITRGSTPKRWSWRGSTRLSRTIRKRSSAALRTAT